MRISDGNLRGRTVIASDGVRIGEIVEFFVDDSEWKLQSIRVKLNKDIADRVGATRSVFHAGTIEIPINLIQSIGDAAVLRARVDQLRELQHPTPAEQAPIQ